MSIYTLADGSTVTVTATEQGIPLNEGMQALTKAIKAKINASSSGSGGASSGKLVPTLELSGSGLRDYGISGGVHTYGFGEGGYAFSGTFDITYNGDGILRVYYRSSDEAQTYFSIASGNKLTIKCPRATSGDGLIVATEGQNYACQVIQFTFDTND